MVKLLQDRFMKALANAVSLRMPGLCFGMLYAIHAKASLTTVLFNHFTIFFIPVLQHPKQIFLQAIHNTSSRRFVPSEQNCCGIRCINYVKKN